jgi:hypothetical protein
MEIYMLPLTKYCQLTKGWIVTSFVDVDDDAIGKPCAGPGQIYKLYFDPAVYNQIVNLGKTMSSRSCEGNMRLQLSSTAHVSAWSDSQPLHSST